MDTEQAERTNQSLQRILRRRAPWILLCVIIAAAAAYGYSKQATKKYTATAALSFNSNPLLEEIAGLPSSGSTIDLLSQQNSNRELVRLGDMAATTAKLLGRGLTEETVRASLGISAQGETSVVDVSSTSTSPALAAEIANTYASQFVKEQQDANHRYFKLALALVRKQLAALSPTQRFGSDGLELQERAQTLRLLVELDYGDVQLAQEAGVPSIPSSPKTKSNTFLGGILGLLFGIALAFLLERLDRRLKEPEELERIYDLPMLGVVPKSRAFEQPPTRGAGGPLPPAEAEVFSLIRAHLRFFNIKRDVRTIAVVSPTAEDGKTTVSRHLAEAAARSGSRVLLLEVDMRHPTLAQQLQITPGPGLASVLIGIAPVDDATQSVALQVPIGEGIGGRTLDVLVAGSVLPPNPGELLESPAMGAMLQKARSDYDLVVIDTPPLTAVSDAFPLLTNVDGVVVVGRIGHSRRDAAEALQPILASSGVPLLGVVANGSNYSHGPGSYANQGSVNSFSGGTPPDGAPSPQQFVRA